MSSFQNPAVLPQSRTRNFLHLKEPASAVTHFIAMVSALLAAPFLLTKAMLHTEPVYLTASALFIISMILLYGASTAYHAIEASPGITLLLKKLDHIMIYILIAGSYSPICFLVLPDRIGFPLGYTVWGLALSGLILTLFWVNSPKWLNSLIYIVMGWLCIFTIKTIYACMAPASFGWLLAGGIIYTIGGVIYALKLPLFRSMHNGFGNHEIFHLFVMAGSLCHFIMVYSIL